MGEDLEDDDLDENPGTPLDDLAARALSRAWKSSPGLVLSLAFHGAILGILPLIIFHERIAELAGIPITIGVSAMRVDPERAYKPVSGGPPSSDGIGRDEPPVVFPDALEAARNERRGLEAEAPVAAGSRTTLEQLVGDADAAGFRGRLASGPPGTNDVMGVGGGSGRGGLRFGGGGLGAGRRNLVARGGGSAATENAVELGLSWLARHQQRDGSWSARVSCGACPDQGFDGPTVGATGLAALAFITAGYVPGSKAGITDRVTRRRLVYGDTLSAALRYLMKKQNGARRIDCGEAPLVAQCGTYEHAFATMALCEAFRVTKDPELGKHAGDALEFLLESQNRGAGWQYVARDGKSDTSVTGACVQALRAASSAGLRVPPESLDGVRTLMGRLTASDGTMGYMVGCVKCGMPRPEDVPATTAIGLYVKRFLEGGTTSSDHSLPLAAKKIAAQIGNACFTRDTYRWYYSMLGLFEYEGPSGPSWRSVNEAVTTALVKSQHQDKPCLTGAWDDDGDGWLASSGRPFDTALSVLTLETYYRYAGSEERSPVTAGPAKLAEPSAVAAPR